MPGETGYLKTITEYDDLGRVKKITAPGNILTILSYGVRSESITNHLGLTSTKSYNAQGWLKSSTDTDSKTVNFTHYSDGKVKTSQVGDITGPKVEFEYDINGNTTKITDPSWGIITNYYNPYNEQYYSLDANEKKYTFIHDKLGRLIEKKNINNAQDIVAWVYDDTGRLGLLISENNLTGHSIEYQYGQFNRVNSISETIDGNQFLTKFDYDLLGRKISLTYPNSLKIKYLYDSYTGELKQVKRSSDDSNIWKAVAYNEAGQITNSKIGDFTLAKTYFPETNLLKTTSSTGIQSFEYSYDQLGNMTDRYDYLHKINDLSLHEHFTYDNRNQLKTITKNGVLQCEMLYDGLGSIYLKTDVGDLNCITAGKPYQLTEIVPNTQINPAYKTDEHITYTDFNKVNTITTDQYLLEITYGLGNERLSQKLYSKNGQGQTLLSEKIYVAGLAEIVEHGDGSSKTINYISSPEGLVAVEITQSSGSKEWYWIFTDHLGSITSLVRESDGQKFEMSFDAWGNRRDPATWVNYTTTLPDFIIDRGFTGHEHYDEFGLINMNGRVYDPVIARFLSPDSYIQAPGLAQNYNGYMYCLNNPLKYTDPSGDFIIEAIMIGAFINTFIQGMTGNIESNGDAFMAFGIGALSGAAGGGAGNAVAGAIGTATTFGGAIANGALIGAAGGFAGGFVGSAGNAWMGGANFGQGLQSGIIGGAIGALGGAVTGGISGGIQYQKQISIFSKGLNELGIDETVTVPATDKFLIDAQQAWFKDAPMDKVKLFTVENVPDNVFIGEGYNAAGSTQPLSGKISGNLTGMSNVYFNKDLAFSSAKKLFFTMGHEFVHVSQFAALAGQHASIIRNLNFRDMLDFHAYSYENSLGGIRLNSFTRDEVIRWSTTYSQFQNMNYIKFPWTFTHSFSYPF